MKINKILCILFALAACCFLAGTVNHIVNTHEGWLSSLLLAGGCLCGAVVFYKKEVGQFQFDEEEIMQENSGWKYMRLALLAVVGFCLEFVLAFMVEPFIFYVSLNEYSTPQYITHWIATCVLWGIVGWGLIMTAKNKYQFNVMKKGNRMVGWQWVIIVICIAVSVSVSYRNWDGFKVIKEFTNLGLLKFVFQYIYYLFETMLVTLVLVFSQEAFEKWFHKTYIPYGGLLLALTWGIGHFLSKDILTGILCLIVSFAYGSFYLLSNRDVLKTYIFVSIMFIL